MSLNNESTSFDSKAQDIRAALDEEIKAPPVIDEDGADKVNLKSQRDVAREKEEDEEVTPEDKAAKKQEKEEAELKAKLGVDEDEKEEELEEELTPEKLDLISPVRRKEILKKYPNLFKEFPYLNVAYSRDQQFTEVFSTVQEAREAVETLQAFDGFRQELMQGNMTSVLKTVKEADPQAFARVVDNVMHAIGTVEPQAYYHILSNQSAALINSMQQQARQTQNQDMMTAANIIQQFVFGRTGEIQPQPFSRPVQQNEQVNQLEQERMQFAQERFQSFSTDIDNKVGNRLKALIETNIDDKDSPKMTPFIKENAINRVFNELSQGMKTDPAYMKQLSNAWERAVRNNFSQESMNMIQTIAMNKGRTSLSKIILKVRSEALKGLGAGTTREKTREPITPGRSTSSSSSGNDKKAPVLKAGESTRDYFDRED